MIIGVDAGTSVVKAVSFDNDGAIIGVSIRPTTTSAPFPGEAEQDLGMILQAVGDTVRDLVSHKNEPVDMLAITAQGDGLWLLDEQGRAVRPGILWSDGRAGSIVETWQQNGISEAAFRRNGNVPFAGSPAAILTYLAIHEPAAIARATTAGYCKDALNQRLTGARSTDLSDASLPFLNHHTRQYDPFLFDLFGLPDLQPLLAPIDQSPGVVRPLTSEGSLLTGLAHGTPVHVGPFDFPATTIGAGVTKPGDGLIALGTTLACGVVKDRVDNSGTPSGMTVALPTANRWVRLLPAMAGTLALDWLLPLISASHRELDQLLLTSTPGAGGVLMLPFVATSGERAPFVDPTARGRLIGLNLETTRSDLARAVCEGIAYAARHCFETAGLAPDGTITMCGGGSRTGQLRQIFANVLGRPVYIARQPETGARGAAIAALQTLGRNIDTEKWTVAEAEIQPERSATALYESGYRHYLAEIERARGNWSGPSR